MTLKPEAHRLAQLGWAVFALGPTGLPYPNCGDCRETCVVAEDYDNCRCLLCHGSWAGTTDANRIEAMWEHLPHSLIGVRTGRASGIVVLDFDRHGNDNGVVAYRRLRDAGLLPATARAATGGGGRHLFYLYPNDNSVNVGANRNGASSYSGHSPAPTPGSSEMVISFPSSGTSSHGETNNNLVRNLRRVPNDNRGKLGKGCDVKADGGYVIAPPSAKRDQPPYRWISGLSPWDLELAELPTDIVALLTKTTEPATVGASYSGSIEDLADNDKRRLIQNFEEALDTLRIIGVGSRNEHLYRAACRGGECVAAGLVKLGEVTEQLSEAGREAGLNPHETRQTIRSGLNRGMHDLTNGNWRNR